MEILVKVYRSVLRFVLRAPSITLLFSSVLFIASFYLIRLLPAELVPAQDQSRFLLRLKAPVGSSIEFTDAKFREAESYMKGVKEVEGYYTTVGGFGGDAVNEGVMFVTLKEPSDRSAAQNEVMDRVRKDLSEMLTKKIKVIAQDLSLRGFSSSRGFPVEINIQGPEWSRLGQLTATMIEKLEKSGAMVDINTDYQVGMPEIQITPDRFAASARGVPINSIATEINTMIGGTVINANTKYPKDRHRYDIRVRLEGSDRFDSNGIQKLKIRNNRGELIPISEVVKVDEKPSLQIISRHNRQRAVSIFANVAAGHAQKEALKIAEKIGQEILPEGYKLVMTGNAQTFRESIESLVVALLLGIFVSYMVLASQFNSFIHPISVLVALPFSVSGAFFALLIGQQSINMFSIIGLILLMGIVKKNSILLVDFTNQLRNQGVGIRDALLEACAVRLRPILMTSVATVAGALPAALKFGPGAETRIPMATAIIGGVIVSTVLTLLVVPCVYTLLARFEKIQAE